MKFFKKNMTTKLVALAAILIAALAVTYHARVEAQTLTDTIARDVTPWYGEDQSTYANQNSRIGLVVRRWDITNAGDAAAIGDNNIGLALPNGAVISRVTVDVEEAFLPASGTLGLEIGTTDLIAIGNGLEAAGVDVTLQDGASANQIVITDATTFVIGDVLTTAYTSGIASIYMEYILTNP